MIIKFEDLLQLPSVISESIYWSNLWHLFFPIFLTVSRHQREDMTFIKLLNEVKSRRYLWWILDDFRRSLCTIHDMEIHIYHIPMRYSSQYQRLHSTEPLIDFYHFICNWLWKWSHIESIWNYKVFQASHRFIRRTQPPCWWMSHISWQFSDPMWNIQWNHRGHHWTSWEWHWQ